MYGADASGLLAPAHATPLIWRRTMTTPGPSVHHPPHPALPYLLSAHGLAPGRALVLGASAGADALWLTANGWTVTVVDASAAAGQRLRDTASTRGIRSGLRVVQRDLTAGIPSETFELVYALQFWTARVEDRAAVLRRAAAHMGIGGHLVIIDREPARTSQQAYDAIGLDGDWESVPFAPGHHPSTQVPESRIGFEDSITIARRIREAAFSARAEADNHRHRHPHHL
jgi:SAM-dependent methyltransferase